MSLKQFSTFENLNTLFTSIGNKFSAINAKIPSSASSSNKLATVSALDEWTSTATVSNNQVTFNGLDDTYGYDLYCDDKPLVITAISKSGSGTNVSLTFTLSGATAGDVCKLRILK